MVKVSFIVEINLIINVSSVKYVKFGDLYWTIQYSSPFLCGTGHQILYHSKINVKTAMFMTDDNLLVLDGKMCPFKGLGR